MNPRMHARSPDTDPAAEQVQIALLRAAPISRRLTLAVSLTESVRSFARRAAKRRWPAADEREIRLHLVEIHFGREVADAIRLRLVTQRE
jgi:hypothetical protein